MNTGLYVTLPILMLNHSGADSVAFMGSPLPQTSWEFSSCRYLKQPSTDNLTNYSEAGQHFALQVLPFDRTSASLGDATSEKRKT